MIMTKAELLYAAQGAATRLLNELAKLKPEGRPSEMAAYFDATAQVLSLIENGNVSIIFEDYTVATQGSFVGEPEVLVRSMNKLVIELHMAQDQQGIAQAMADHITVVTELLKTIGGLS